MITLNDQSVRIEDARDPGNLLFAAEGERTTALAARRAWRDFISTHPGCQIQSVDLHLDAAMPFALRCESVKDVIWFTRRVVGRRTMQRLKHRMKNAKQTEEVNEGT